MDSFSKRCAKSFDLSPLRHIQDVMKESINDELTLRNCYISGYISRGKGSKSESVHESQESARDKKFVNGKFVATKELEDDDPEKTYSETTKWSYDAERLTGFWSLSQEAAVAFLQQGGIWT